MAVARMAKVSVLGYLPTMDAVVERLQRADVMDIVAVQDSLGEDARLPEGVSPVELAPNDARVEGLREHAADAHFVREFLGRYHVPSNRFSTFVSEKFHMAEDDFVSLEPDLSFQRLYRECVQLADRMATLDRECERLRDLEHDLEPWQGFRLQIEQWRGTEQTVLFTGTVPASEGPAIRQALRDAVGEVTVEELGPIGTRQAWVVVAHRCCLERVRQTLALTSFAEVSFPELADYPAEELARARERQLEIREEEERLGERSRELAGAHFADVTALAEALDSELDALMVRERFAATGRAFLATGWVRESQRARLASSLGELSDDVDVTFDEPGPEDEPPVALANPRILHPFELLTDLYGRPRYREIDPTPLLAPFFLVFFGLCIGDVGYGAMLIAGAWLIKNRLDVAPGVRRFMDLVMLGGLSAAVFGVLFGSYFAIPYESLPPILQSLRVVDPLVDLQLFLLGTILLGVVQVFFGVLLAAWDCFRRGDPAEAVSAHLSVIFLFGMLVVAVAIPGAWRWAIPVGVGITIILQGRVIRAAVGEADRPMWDRSLGVLWLVMLLVWIVSMATGFSVAGWVFLGVTVVGVAASATVRGAAMGVLGGAYSVYSMTSFLGDVLSYTRLAALGLSSALVGYVFNLLAGLVWDGAGGLFAGGGAAIVGGVFVVVFAAAIFVVGHTFNVVINLLGAFVHPARLQYVEFFSKFYEGGGAPFKPFGLRSKSVVLHAGATRQEGGTSS